MNKELMEHIKRLKEDKKALILAHYYVNDDIQEVADFVGDSYYLSKLAMERPEDIIIFCGVSFMGESAKILSPNKTIISPNVDAKCPMAYMISIDKIKEIRKKYDDLAVVCYINSTSEVKANSDVCVTSSNAIKIIKNLKEKNIFFIPDNNLGKYLSTKIENKNFIFHDGYCPIHENISKEQVVKLRNIHRDAKIVVHPECNYDVISIGDFVGSTSGIIDYVYKSSQKEFIVCTEEGILYELKNKNPGKKFYKVAPYQICNDMKKITLENVLRSLTNLDSQVLVDDYIKVRAEKALKNMHELAR